MDYLDLAKEIQAANKAKKAKEASQTLQLPSADVRNKSVWPVTETVAHLGVVLPVKPDALPRLPWQLERLISAACADVLPQGTEMLGSGLVPDLGRYVMAWGCPYLTGDRDEAERRLWQVYCTWKEVK